eukprot:TRINITY_DN123498_c0_g1_i1.p1 TRINITY_DN123498_c0_g1~~TRINITY_DN123498_c0_g1_i1.p1  ORF type:complete len:209 (-),score=60.90 TRINITY_DN123498_c0_g1_i1:507-1133(-)
MDMFANNFAVNMFANMFCCQSAPKGKEPPSYTFKIDSQPPCFTFKVDPSNEIAPPAPPAATWWPATAKTVAQDGEPQSRKEEAEAEAEEVQVAKLAAELEERLQVDREECQRPELEVKEVQQAEDRKKMNLFLERYSFAGPDVKRSSSYPLHAAVKQRDVDMARILISHGAKLTCQDSKGYTPLQLAQKIDRAGSHNDVIAVLRSFDI